MSHTIEAQKVTAGMIVHASVNSAAITVSDVRHNVNHYTRRVTVVSRTDSNGVLAGLICDPEFEFVLPL